MAVRRAALSKFGEHAIQKDWPMATLEDVLVPVYLYHRYSAEAAAHTIGGQNYIYALRGDGRRILSATCTCQRTITGTVISAMTTRLYAWQYDPTNDTIQAFNTTSGAEASGSLSSIQTEWSVESA